jgi:hypothetical protein
MIVIILFLAPFASGWTSWAEVIHEIDSNFRAHRRSCFCGVFFSLGSHKPPQIVFFYHIVTFTIHLLVVRRSSCGLQLNCLFILKQYHKHIIWIILFSCPRWKLQLPRDYIVIVLQQRNPGRIMQILHAIKGCLNLFKCLFYYTSGP